MNEQINFVFKNYPLHIIVSNSQRPIKYEFSKSKLLKKFLNKNVFQFKEGSNYVYKNIEGDELNQNEILNNNYTWRTKTIKKNNRYYLQSIDNDIVLANMKTAGTQRTKVINGQNLHQLTMATYDRAKIILTLKNYFIAELKNYIIPKNIILPIHIQYIFYSNKNKIESDLNNHSLFYEKVFSDIIQHEIVLNKEEGKIKNVLGIIPDDTLQNYTSYEIHHCYLPKEEENHYLNITIYDNVNNKILLNKLNTNSLIELL